MHMAYVTVMTLMLAGLGYYLISMHMSYGDSWLWLSVVRKVKTQDADKPFNNLTRKAPRALYRPDANDMCLQRASTGGDAVSFHDHVRGNTVSRRMRWWHRGRSHSRGGICTHYGPASCIKPSTDDQAPAVFSVRSPSGLARWSSRHAAGWFISHAYVELIWWTLPDRTVCQASFRHLIVYARCSSARPHSRHCDRTRRAVGLVISRRRHGRAVVYYTNVTDSPGWQLEMLQHFNRVEAFHPRQQTAFILSATN